MFWGIRIKLGQRWNRRRTLELIILLVSLIGIILFFCGLIGIIFLPFQSAVSLTLLAIAFACESALLMEKGKDKKLKGEARKGLCTQRHRRSA